MSRRYNICVTRSVPGEQLVPDGGHLCSAAMARLLPYLLLLAVLCWDDVRGSATPATCHLDNIGQLKQCVQSVLNDYRPQLAARFDPLRLPSISGSRGRHRYWLSNIVVKGASTIQIRHVYVRPVGSSSASIRLAVHWPHLRAELKVKARLCKKILWKKRCITQRARPRISVHGATASLSTRWSAAVKGDKFVIIPSNTKININLRTIRVNPKLGGVAGVLYKLFGRIAKRLVNKWVRKAWNKRRPDIERKLSKELEKLINKNIGPALSKVMRGKVSSIKSIPRTTPRKIVRPPRFSIDPCRRGPYRRPGLPQRLAPRPMC